MTSKVYVLPEDPITFKATGGTVVFAPTTLATLNGWQSAQHNFGRTARPYQFNWRAYVKFDTAPVLGETVDIYLKTSDGTHADNDDLTTSSAVSAEDKLKNLQYIGSITVDQDVVADIEMVASGTVTITHQYVQVVFWNATVDSLSDVAADNGFILEPIVAQGQAT